MRNSYMNTRKMSQPNDFWGYGPNAGRGGNVGPKPQQPRHRQSDADIARKVLPVVFGVLFVTLCLVALSASPQLMGAVRAWLPA
jgi:hypothetical protein